MDMRAGDNGRTLMIMKNYEITKAVKTALEGRWGLAIGAYFVVTIIFMLLGNIPFFGWIACLLLTGPFNVGIGIFSLNLLRGKKVEFKQIFDGFGHFGVAMVAYLLVFMYTFLWTLLFIIPGVIAFLSYSMTFYIIADNVHISEKEALNKSKQLMAGNKRKLFFLYCRFFGWFLLSIITLGIGFLFLAPYVGISVAKFYDDIK